MEKKKVLLVNASLCDARNVQESTLAAYEKVVVNAATVLVSQGSRELLDRYSVALNSDAVLAVEGDVHLNTVNGRAEIKPGQALPAGKTLLLVNGVLEMFPGSEALLAGYCGIQVNGRLLCPESLAGLLAMARVNGKLETYPDDCIRLRSTAILDRTFPLRARQNGRYYAARRVVALDPAADLGKLVERNVRFITQELLVAESLTEAALPLFDEQAEITILPDGCAYVADDVKLDDALLRRYGDKLYVNGDVTVDGDSGNCLGRVRCLRINGDALVTRDQMDAFLAMGAEYDQLRIVAGRLLRDKLSVTVDRAMLEQATEGVGVIDCVNVKIHGDVPPQLLRERLLTLSDCVNVSCTPEQRAALELVASDVVRIDDSGSGLLDQNGGMLSQLADLLGEGSLSGAERASLLRHSKVVNSAEYTL